MEMHVFDSKIGKIAIFSDGKFITKIELSSSQKNNETNNELIQKTKTQILEYLDGLRHDFEIPYKIEGTEFQIKVLKAILAIPFGETTSYSDLAKSIGYSKAYRACGTVCKSNNLPLIIPCHRVIKSNGDLGEYLGGKEAKETLINLEKLL